MDGHRYHILHQDHHRRQGQEDPQDGKTRPPPSPNTGRLGGRRYLEEDPQNGKTRPPPTQHWQAGWQVVSGLALPPSPAIFHRQN